jgi:hypothetical protein
MGAKLGLMLREERRLSVFENRVLRRIFGQKYQGTGQNCMVNSCIISTLHVIILGGVVKIDEMGCTGHARRK